MRIKAHKGVKSFDYERLYTFFVDKSTKGEKDYADIFTVVVREE